ncbi:MAG: Sau3AI family type II restriction endonuclease [Candidatus Pacebacteria bacterium]|nr:Sau3AI family type II restriction endonuclease [Candidatus Paceibacterota bacterium]
MQDTQYQTAEDVITAAEAVLGKTLRDIVSKEEADDIEKQLGKYGTRRKGFFGDLVEQYVFDLENNGRAEADFKVANVELKATPLKKHNKKRFVSKERLVFSMINYDTVISEKWETSSFLKKNRFLLLIFYLWLKEASLLDYKFKFVHFLDLLEGLSQEDVVQIKKDWECIVDKIRDGKAHELSEGDTFYLGACTKAAHSRVVRDQPKSRIPAKPRAFSLKQAYLNYLIQTKLLGVSPDEVSIYKGAPKTKTIDQVVEDRFRKFIGKTDTEILKMLKWKPKVKPKNYKRLIANHILTGTGSNKVEELEKADVTLKVLALEPDGSLKESVSFPAFNFKDLVTQVWYDEEAEQMSDFHAQLEEKKFLFVVFQKQEESDEIILQKTMFWNFPAEDMGKARETWEKTIELLNEGKIIKKVPQKADGRIYNHFPGSTFNGVAHVRPHTTNRGITNELPVPDQLTGWKTFTKQGFWLNAKYIQHAIENDKDQD